MSDHKEENAPGLSNLLYCLSIFSAIGGFILGALVWPGDPSPGMYWKFEAYVPSIIWLSVGLTECLMFVIVAQILKYLHQIAENTAVNRNTILSIRDSIAFVSDNRQINGLKAIFPEIVQCPICHEQLELEESERMTGVFTCPTCHKSISSQDFKTE